MKSLADQIREEMGRPKTKKEKSTKKNVHKVESAILDALLTFDTSPNKSMVHVRFDERTVKTLNQFKLATNVDVTKLVAFAVQHLFETCPELKTIIKQYLINEQL
ncbi:MAG: hypothetical protein EOO01_05065 [Chitinophagaceae bacterium]|nr:MAG: hypothetical protein EOO01_05065 [Chitinophagaceae bacterium]